jgi:hypothetical protein
MPVNASSLLLPALLLPVPAPPLLLRSGALGRLVA